MKTITIFIPLFFCAFLHGESLVSPSARNVAVAINTKPDRADQALIQLGSLPDLKNLISNLPKSVGQSVNENYIAVSSVRILNPGEIGGNLAAIVAKLNKQLIDQNIEIEILFERRSDAKISMEPRRFYSGQELIPLDRLLDFIGDANGLPWVALPFGKIVFLKSPPVH